MKQLTTLCLLLAGLCSYSQSAEGLLIFVEDYTQDKRINDKDIIFVYYPGINEMIEKEEWDRKDIDLSINDISLKEITPRRIPRTIAMPGEEEDSIRTDLLAFVIQKEKLSREQLDGLRNLESMESAFVILSLPNDADLQGTLTIYGLTRTRYLQVGAWVAVAIIAIFLIYVGFWTNALRDSSELESHKPYSFSKSQVFWWTLIVISSIAYIFISTSQFALNPTVWILLAISGGTLGVSSAIDRRDINSVGISRHQDSPGEDWFNDVLKDNTGSISIHRAQAFLFNLGFGVYYLIEVYNTLQLPSFDSDILTLLGLSNGAYALIKNNENTTSADSKK